MDFEFIENLRKGRDEKEIISFYLAYIKNILNCDGATFFTYNPKKKILTFEIVEGKLKEELEGISFPLSGIAGWVFENRKDILVKKTSESPFFTNKIDRVTEYKTKSVICILLEWDDEVYGACEFLNPVLKDEFDEDDFKKAQILSFPLEMMLRIKRLESSILTANRRLFSAIENLSGGFIGIDTTNRIILINKRAYEILGLSDDWIGKNINLLPDEFDIIKKALKEALSGNCAKRLEFFLETKKIGYSTIQLKSVDGEILGSGIIFQEIQ